MTDALPSLLLTGEAESLGADRVALLNTLLAELEAGLRTLPDKPEETSVSALRALWHLASDHAVSAARALQLPLPPLDTSAQERLRVLLRQRLSGVPLAHLTGRQQFMGLEMLAGPGALIPRHETEILGRVALDLLGQLATAQSTVHVIDVCTGSGNLAAALAAAAPAARVFAADLSAEAVALARRNVEHLGLADRVQLGVGDLLAPFDTADHLGRVDLLTCNPPYISTGRMATMPDEIVGHEPSLAFDGGPLGVRILQRLIKEAPRFLRPGGWLAFEVGLGQGPSVAQRLRKSGAFGEVHTHDDAQGQVRVLSARV